MTELDPPQLQVLEALSRGTGVFGAAEILGRPVETVVEQLTDARRLLGGKDTTHAVAEALRRGLIR